MSSSSILSKVSFLVYGNSNKLVGPSRLHQIAELVETHHRLQKLEKNRITESMCIDRKDFTIDNDDESGRSFMNRPFQGEPFEHDPEEFTLLLDKFCNL